jgi:LysR family glycine cleavage system transcriptional activator
MYIPPLNALRAFEAAARHLSFKKAAEELCVTQGAISRHIKHLEATLGFRLFTRAHTAVTLTPEGESYSIEIHKAFAAIARATANCTAVIDNAILKVKVPPTCAIRWLMPRLHLFQENVSIQLVTSHQPFNAESDNFDVAIQYNPSDIDLVKCELLFNEMMVPVCSGEMAEHSGIKAVNDLANQVLLKSMLRPTDWPRWFEMVGVSDKHRPEKELIFENASLTYEAAEKGFGVALAQAAFVEDELLANRLVVPINRRLTGKSGYYLVIPRDRARLRKVRTFRNWIMGEAAITQRALSAFLA